jgi:septation ring formation regulator EzrA
MMDTKDKLDRLAELQAQADVIRLHYDEIRDTIVPPEIKQQLIDLDAEYSTSIESLNEGIANLTSEIKQDILQNGGSVKGDYLHAIWVKGRVSWDTKSLDGYALGHPELLALRKEGEPSVTIRQINKG